MPKYTIIVETYSGKSSVGASVHEDNYDCDNTARNRMEELAKGLLTGATDRVDCQVKSGKRVVGCKTITARDRVDVLAWDELV